MLSVFGAFPRLVDMFFPINVTFEVINSKNTLDYCILEHRTCCSGSWSFLAAGLILAACLTWLIHPVLRRVFLTGAAESACAKGAARAAVPASRVCNFLSISVSSSFPFRGQMESEVQCAICARGESGANSTQGIKMSSLLTSRGNNAKF